MCKYKDQCTFTHDKSNHPFLFHHHNNNVSQLPPIPSHIFNIATKCSSNQSNNPTQSHTHLVHQSCSHSHPLHPSLLNTGSNCIDNISSKNNVKEDDIISTMQHEPCAGNGKLDDVCKSFKDNNIESVISCELSMEETVNSLTIINDTNVKTNELSIEDNINTITINNNNGLINNEENILQPNRQEMIKQIDMEFEQSIKQLEMEFSTKDKKLNCNYDANADLDDTSQYNTTDDTCYDFKLGASCCCYDLDFFNYGSDACCKQHEHFAHCCRKQVRFSFALIHQKVVLSFCSCQNIPKLKRKAE